ncbi:MAG: response regulator transcription factor [Coprobacter sp.]|nr:response regulator transcription factor [Coprobacter sp.]
MGRKVLKIAIAEPSVILRSGVTSVIRRIPGFHIQPIEIAHIESLADCLRLHKPDVLIVNPALMGYADLRKFKTECNVPHIKCVALLCSVVEGSLLNRYDGQFSIYDEAESVSGKISSLLSCPADSEVQTQMLSDREKEIVVGVVKGLTNKEIAERLFLSAHTVITHRRNIAKKLQIHSAAGLTIYAIVNKLVELEEIGKFNLRNEV